MSYIETQYFNSNAPFKLTSGLELPELTLAYKTFGTLNENKDNAILVFHVLTSSQNATGVDPFGGSSSYWTKECHQGWWSHMIGPDKAINTNNHFVICANYLGGCYGSTGPQSINPITQQKYGDSFPILQIEDIVNSQILLLNHLEIQKLKGVVGASLGGLMALDLALRFSNRVDKVISVASGLRVQQEVRHSNLAQLQVLEKHNDLALARIIAMQSYLNFDNMKFEDHEVDDFFQRHGENFIHRFDPISYHRIVTAWQNYRPQIELLSKSQNQSWLLFSIEGDRCFSPKEQNLLFNELQKNNIATQIKHIQSPLGHDSFLKESLPYEHTMRDFL